MRLIDRIFEYLKFHHLTPYHFERDCGIANGYLQKQNKGKGTIGSEILEKISEKCPDLNIAWLITGTGRMLKSKTDYTASSTASLSEDQSSYSLNQATIASLHEKIAILENALADKEKIIRLLEEKSSVTQSPLRAQ